jgi:hypothetical protein
LKTLRKSSKIKLKIQYHYFTKAFIFLGGINMDSYVICRNCFCENPHTKIYQCSGCKKYFCDECKEENNKCPHCGVEAGTYEVKGEIITNR